MLTDSCVPRISFETINLTKFYPVVAYDISRKNVVIHVSRLQPHTEIYKIGSPVVKSNFGNFGVINSFCESINMNNNIGLLTTHFQLFFFLLAVGYASNCTVLSHGLIYRLHFLKTSCFTFEHFSVLFERFLHL